MKLNELLSCDQQLVLEHSSIEKEDFVFEGLAVLEEQELFASAVCFVKDKTFLQSALALKERAKDLKISLVIDKKFFSGINDELLGDLQKHFVCLFSSQNVGLSLARLSLPYFKKIKKEENNLVDGRQMGSAVISPMADIAQDVFIGSGTQVMAGAKIHSGVRIESDCVIGEDCEIFPNVTLYSKTKLGKRVIIHANTVIGADGFGYEFHEGVHHKVYHLGRVEIDDDVEIGSISSIDRATLGATRVGAGSKIDNLVQIGHNCQIGRGVIICGHTGLSGSSKVGDFCVIGGKAGVGPGVEIGKNCQVAGAAMVTKGDWPDGTVLAGHPARPYKEWMKGVAYLRKMSLRS